MKKIALIIGFLIGFAAVCKGTPTTPSNVTWSSTLLNGTTMTITVTGAGSVPPVPVIYDNLESGVVGSSISVSAGGATFGQWLARSSSAPLYSNQQFFSGAQSFMSQCFGVPNSDPFMKVDFSSTSQMYFSFAWMSVNDWPGYANGGVNNKIIWPMKGDSTTNSDVYVAYLNSTANQPPNSRLYGSNMFGSIKTFSANTSSGTWHQWAGLIEGRSSTGGIGRISFWEINGTIIQRFNQIGNNSGAIIFTSTSNWFDNVHDNGYCRNNGAGATGTLLFKDDIYYSTGPAAAARIWITDQPTIALSTKFANAWVKTWSDTSITAIYEQGNFPTNGTGYVQVCGSDDTCSPTGFSVTLGGGIPPPLGIQLTETGAFSESGSMQLTFQ